LDVAVNEGLSDLHFRTIPQDVAPAELEHLTAADSSDRQQHDHRVFWLLKFVQNLQACSGVSTMAS
jgi:hypothetical protein